MRRPGPIARISLVVGHQYFDGAPIFSQGRPPLPFPFSPLEAVVRESSLRRFLKF